MRAIGQPERNKGTDNRLAGELAVITLSLAMLPTYLRLFEGTGARLPILAATLGAHLAVVAARRAGLGLFWSAFSLMAGFVVIGGWAWYPSTLVAGLPGPDTLSAAVADLREAWSLFVEITSPAPATKGFVIVSAVAISVSVFLADWAAFRIRSPVEAVAPSAIVFMFAGLLAADGGHGGFAILYSSAVLAHLLASRLADAASEYWQSGELARGSGSMMRSGSLLAGASLAVGLFVGPYVPGSGDVALLNWREGQDAPGSRVTVSPLVDIRSRLVEQSEVEVMTVRSTTRAYWRLTSLDTFDGRIWKSGGRYKEARGDLVGTLDEDVETIKIAQEFRILALAQLWLPAAFEPRAIVADGATARYESGSGTLIVDTSETNSDGLTYEVTSAVPRFDPAALATSGLEIPQDISERYLSLPDRFSAEASRLATEVTAGEDTPYGKAVALQEFFRSEFTYDLDVESGHGSSAIDAFLDDRRGYCEQFSGTYAAMARFLGIPSRVAVGFTPGDVDPTDPTLFHVRGAHAHAWPEIWIAGAGWVAMEPTPGRGAPGAERWTGVPEEQVGSPPASPTSTIPMTSTTALGDDDGTGPTTEAPPVSVGDSGSSPRGGSGSGGITMDLVPVARMLLLLGGLWLVLVPASLYARRSLRRARATTESRRVLVFWREAQDELRAIGVVRRPSETHQEFASRSVSTVGSQGKSLLRLAELADGADYGPSAAEGSATEARDSLTLVRRAVRKRNSGFKALLRWLDPRELIPSENLLPQ